VCSLLKQINVALPALYFLLICLTVKEHLELLGHSLFTVGISSALLCGTEENSGNYLMMEQKVLLPESRCGHF